MYSRFGAGLSSWRWELTTQSVCKAVFRPRYSQGEFRITGERFFLLVFVYALGLMIRLGDSSVYAVADDDVDPSWSIRRQRLLNQRIGMPLRAPARSIV